MDIKASNTVTSFGEPSDVAPNNGKSPQKTVTMVFGYTGVAQSASATLDTPLERIERLYLVGYHVTNPSTANPIRIQFDNSGSSSFVNGLNTLGSISQTNFLVIANQTTAAGYGSGSIKQLIGSWKLGDGKIHKLGLRLYDLYTGAEITWTNLMLVFKAKALTWH